MSVATVSSRASVQSAIALAARTTGVDFGYLLGQAKLESGLNPSARAGTSSASGLYQFIEQSWLGVIKKHGAEHGLSWAADAIGQSSSGRLSIGDPAARRAVLDLRNDPQVSSLMAAEYASDNKNALEGSLGRAATGTDLYMAHFLGLGGAHQFLSTMRSSPQAIGASLFPAAARANRNVFFASDGSPRTLAAIYDRFSDKLGDAAGGAAAMPAVDYAAQALDMDGATVVTGSGESAETALAWASSVGHLNGARMQTASLLRPTPDTARLAYMMLASMGA